MNMLLPAALYFALCCFGIAVIFATVRLWLGPSAQDRILALDTLYINGLLIILTLGIELGSLLYFDIALLIALFGFVGSAALAKFLLRGELIEP